MSTKACDACGQEIGASEKECPKCGVDFEELEDAIATVSKAQEVIEKRKAVASPKPPEKKEESKKPFRSLGSILRKQVK